MPVVSKVYARLRIFYSSRKKNYRFSCEEVNTVLCFYNVITPYCFASVPSACVLRVNALQLPLFFSILFALILVKCM